MSESIKEKTTETDRECTVCSHVFRDPRILPCMHTFCLKCIEQVGCDKKPGEHMTCPSCEKEFKIPSSGFSGIPINEFWTKLIVFLHPTKLTCDNCNDEDDQTSEMVPVAIRFCVDCDQNLCEDCCVAHKKLKKMRDHHMKELQAHVHKSAESDDTTSFENSVSTTKNEEWLNNEDSVSSQTVVDQEHRLSTTTAEADQNDSNEQVTRSSAGQDEEQHGCKTDKDNERNQSENENEEITIAGTTLFNNTMENVNVTSNANWELDEPHSNEACYLNEMEAVCVLPCHVDVDENTVAHMIETNVVQDGSDSTELLHDSQTSLVLTEDREGVDRGDPNNVSELRERSEMDVSYEMDDKTDSEMLKDSTNPYEREEGSTGEQQYVSDGVQDGCKEEYPQPSSMDGQNRTGRMGNEEQDSSNGTTEKFEGQSIETMAIKNKNKTDSEAEHDGTGPKHIDEENESQEQISDLMESVEGNELQNSQSKGSKNWNRKQRTSWKKKQEAVQIVSTSGCEKKTDESNKPGKKAKDKTQNIGEPATKQSTTTLPQTVESQSHTENNSPRECGPGTKSKGKSKMKKKESSANTSNSVENSIEKMMKTTIPITSNEPIATRIDCHITLKRLNLRSFYDTKLTWMQMITVSKTDFDEEKGLTIIRKLMMLDHRAPTALSSFSIQSPVNLGAKGSSIEQKLLKFSKVSEGSGQHVHPMDIINAIYNCCDMVLLQILTGKLFMCRLAIPMLLPDLRRQNSIFQLWSLRNIVPEWKDKDNKLNQLSLVNITHPVISFLRIGNLKRSKSQLINKLLSSSNHDTFFHRDCKNGTIQRVDSNGTVEMSCFFPTEINIKLKKMFSVFNLRGDGNEYVKESKFLFETSSLVIVMMSLGIAKSKSYLDLIRWKSSTVDLQTRVVLSFVCDSINESVDESQSIILECVKFFKEHNMEVIDVVVDWQGVNFPVSFEEWKSEVENVIHEFLEKCSVTKTLLVNANMAKMNGFLIDEDDPGCKDSYEKVRKLLEPIKKIVCAERKSILLPLQGDPWKEWGKLQKEFKRERKLEESGIAENQAKQDKLRLKQIQLYKTSQLNFVETFVTILHQLDGSVMDKYFPIWVKLMLDESSRNSLPALHDEYHRKWAEIRKQERSTSTDRKSELTVLEKRLSDASFGLEHILREMGQIYEAMKQTPKASHTSEFVKSTNNLPTLAAKLLMRGIPFELMDGDAATVPVTWVKAVFNEIEKIIGKKSLFIISVVGIQSSGKSTLLNTMFGLEFTVSAGRCTRGVYCQLVPVDRNNVKLNCDYILIVDTEGLRAPELQEASMVHDNELATFVIGLGDITLVNIKGEVVADIQDVLQIVIHAMLRIKLVNEKKVLLQPRCMFIHQNVPAVSAEERMKFGQEKFLSFLDRMTKAAADQENILYITRFDQVVQFDYKTHILYLPDLWQGEPPMATVNCAYSDKVEKLKTLIIDAAAQNTNCIRIKQLSSRLSDLWEAILHENFVFSFKNSEEVKAFLNLDAHFSKLSWEFKNESLIWQKRIVNDILSSTDNLKTHGKHRQQEGFQILIKTQEALQKKLQEYFDESENRDILEQWRGRYLQNFINVCKDEQNRMVRDIDKYVEVRSVQLKGEEAAKSYRDKVFDLANQSAKQLKERSKTLTDAELNKCFETNWNDWISHLPPAFNDGDSKTTILATFHRELFQYFTSHSELLHTILSENPLSYLHGYRFASGFQINAQDLSFGNPEYSKEGNVFKKLYHRFTKPSTKEMEIRCVNLASQECLNIGTQIMAFVAGLKGHDFQENNVAQIIQFLDTFFREMDEKKCTNGYIFQHRCKIKFTVHICKCAANEFIVLRNNFRTSRHPLTQIQRDKPTLLKLFKNAYADIAKENMAADMLSKMLQNWIKQTILRDIGRLTADIVVTDDPSFQTKQTFINRVLSDLCLQKDFSEYMLYIKMEGMFLRNKISEYSSIHLQSESDEKGRNKFDHLIFNEVKSYISKILGYLNKCEYMEFENQKQYFDEFQQNLTEYIECPTSDIEIILKMQAVKNCMNFTKYLIESFQESSSAIIESISEAEESRESEFCLGGTDRDELLATKVLGCPERCPFCKAPCCLTEEDHACDHRALQHYPVGVTGIHRKESLELCIHNCQSAVDSNYIFPFDHTRPDFYEPFSDYKKYHPRWEIAPDRSMETSLYWKWFMATYHSALVEFYGVKPGAIPDLWNDITVDQARESLTKF